MKGTNQSIHRKTWWTRYCHWFLLWFI